MKKTTVITVKVPQTKSIRLTKKDIGRWVRVRYTDVGVRDVLVVEVEPCSKGEPWVKIFEPSTNIGLTTLNTDVIAKGPFTAIPAF